VAYVLQTGDQTRKHGPEAFRLDVLSVRARMRQQTFLLMHLGVPSRPLLHVHRLRDPPHIQLEAFSAD
jgi:hypothetical protein